MTTRLVVTCVNCGEEEVFIDTVAQSDHITRTAANTYTCNSCGYKTSDSGTAPKFVEDEKTI